MIKLAPKFKIRLVAFTTAGLAFVRGLVPFVKAALFFHLEAGHCGGQFLALKGDVYIYVHPRTQNSGHFVRLKIVVRKSSLCSYLTSSLSEFSILFFSAFISFLGTFNV
jgi:hypothetical protein